MANREVFAPQKPTGDPSPDQARLRSAFSYLSREHYRSLNGSLVRPFRAETILLVCLITGGCGRAPHALAPIPTAGEWQQFDGTWTAAGVRYNMPLGPQRRASIADLSGSLMLRGSSPPAVGFRTDAIVLNDSATGMTGRAVWTDHNGDQAYSELRGEGTRTNNRVFGTFIGGTGRYVGLSGSYEFSWRFVLENEDGNIEGQSVGLKGQVHLVPTKEAAGARSHQP